MPPGTNLMHLDGGCWEEFNGHSSVNQGPSQPSPLWAAFIVTGNERSSHLIIPRFMMSGDSHLSIRPGTDCCSAMHSWFQMWAACVGLPCRADVTGCGSYLLNQAEGLGCEHRDSPCYGTQQMPLGR